MPFLDGIRIVCVSRGTAAPFAVQLLTELGAEIILVEPPATVRSADDLIRLRGQRSIVVDAARPEGAALIERVAAGADVLLAEPDIEGRNPVAASYERLSALNPRLIYCRLTGSGDEGPLAGDWAADHLIAARYGVYDQPGWRPGPTFLVPPVPSLGAALLAVQAIGAALYLREQTGAGQEVTTSLLAGALAYQPGILAAENGAAGPSRPAAFRTPAGSMPLYSLYECADGQWMHIGCLTPEFHKKGMRSLGLEVELLALGFGTTAAEANHDAIVAAVSARMRERSYAEWAAIFEAADVPYARSQFTDELLEDPQVRHQGLIVTLDEPGVGPMQQMTSILSIDGYDSTPKLPAPSPGQDTDAVCREFGLDDAAIAALRRSGAIA